LGFIFLVVNATAIDLYAFGLVPLALIAPFSGLTIVFSLIIAASGLLHERELISQSQLRGCALVLVGITTVSTCGPRAPMESTMAELLDNFANPVFIAFFTITSGMTAAHLALMHCAALRHLQPAVGSPWATLFAACTAAAMGALSQLCIKVVSVALQGVPLHGLQALAHAAVVVSIVGLALSAPLQLYLLNSALTSSPVTSAVPMYQALLVLFTTTAGGIFFGEFAETSAASMLADAAGAAITMAGLAWLGAAASGDGRVAQKARVIQQA
jgi:hypothetical protein